jgi:photosystem II stability/assembly factor-like uncharacterized protein
MKSSCILLVLIFFLNISSETKAQNDWFVQTSGTIWHLEFVYFINPNTGWTGCPGLILKTVNGGINWNILNQGSLEFKRLFFLNENTGWVIYTNINNAWFIGKTTNGGSNWNIQYTSGLTDLYSMFFLDQNTGWVVGSENIILKTTNSGTNWNSQPKLQLGELAKVQFINQTTGWIGGTGYYSQRGLARTTNGGENWVIVESDIYFRDFSFINENTGWCLCDDVGLVKKTTNSGVNWITQFSVPYPDRYKSIQFVNKDTGWVVGDGGYNYGYSPRITATRNGGQNWIHQWPPIVQSWNFLNTLYFVNQNTGWAVGGRGYIIKTTNGGGEGGTFIEPIKNSVPDKYQLYQNYPNPFNPATAIEFDIPKISFVKLVVYDVLGKEAAVLVNEELKAGSYKIDFNAGNLSSGIYYYRLQTEKFTDTKKLIVVK